MAKNWDVPREEGVEQSACQYIYREGLVVFSKKMTEHQCQHAGGQQRLQQGPENTQIGPAVFQLYALLDQLPQQETVSLEGLYLFFKHNYLKISSGGAFPRISTQL